MKTSHLPAAALVLAATLLAAPGAMAQATAPELGHTLTELPEPIPAPGFTLEDMDGEEHALADYRGQVVLLNFWATWCPPCVREMPSMQRLYENLEGEAFSVVAVNQFETPDHVFAWTGQLSTFPTFPILFDPDSALAQEFGVRGLPTTYLLDPEGRVRYRAIGGREFDHPEVERLIRDLLPGS